MPDITARNKAGYLAIGIANLAIDMLLPTLVLFALTPTGIPAAILLTIGGTLLTGKAIGGRVESGQFRWRMAIVVALVPTAIVLGGYFAGFGNVASMTAGAIVSGAIIVGDVVRSRLRKAGRQIDIFALVVLLEVATSVVLTSISGDARFVLARTSIYIAIAGAAIFATTWAKQPLMRTALKPVAVKGDPVRDAAFERTWEKSREFRLLYRVMTAGLGAVFLIDAVLRLVIVYGQPAAAVVESSFTSQVPLIAMIVIWFAAGRGLAVPRTQRLLEAELASGSIPSGDSAATGQNVAR
jgi:hypothetical protein